MFNKELSKILTIFIALVWFANGLIYKLLNLVPRHQQIVSSIVGDEHSRILTVIIGMLEIGMAFWVLSKFKSKINTLVQIALVITMNILEFTLVPDLLLWGRLNLLFALLFIGLVWCNEFILTRNQNIAIV